MGDAVTLWGDEARVAEAIAGLFALGATEILVSPVPAGDDRAAALERTLRLLSHVAQVGLPASTTRLGGSQVAGPRQRLLGLLSRLLREDGL